MTLADAVQSNHPALAAPAVIEAQTPPVDPRDRFFDTADLAKDLKRRTVRG